MNAQMITKETIRKVIVIKAATAGDLLTERQQLLVNFAIGFAIVDCVRVIAAIADDDVLAVRRYARGVDPIQNSPASYLQSLQHVVSAARGRFAGHRTQEGVQLIVETKQASRQSRYAFEKAKFSEPFERNFQHAVTAATGDVQRVVVNLDVRIQVAGKLGGAAPGARDLRGGQIDLVDVLAHITGRPVHPILVIGD